MPRSKCPQARYPAQDINEDTRFYKDHFYADKVLVRNDDFPHVYLRFHHGENTWNAEHIMLRLANMAPAPSVQIHGYMPLISQAYLREVLEREYSGLGD